MCAATHMSYHMALAHTLQQTFPLTASTADSCMTGAHGRCMAECK